MPHLQLNLIFLSVCQSVCLAVGQVLLKIALKQMGVFSWTWQFFKGALTNWWFLATGVLMTASTLIWFYILRHFSLSSAYPMTCMSFVFGMLAAWLFLGETIPATRWIGVGFVIIGVFFIAK